MDISKFVCILIIFCLGCAGPQKPDPLLEKAFLLHKQSLQTAKETRNLLEGLPENDSNRLQLVTRLNTWNENLIEVPGFEHDHDHDHDHDHHHDHHSGSEIVLSPEDMLTVQKELLDSVQAIKKAVLSQEQVVRQ